MTPTNKIVLDSYALLMYLNDEPGADKVEGILTSALRGTLHLFMNEIYLGEVFYTIAKMFNLETAEEKILEIRALNINWLVPDKAMIFKAARFKARFPISYADGFLAATCVETGGTLLTGDPKFENLEGEIKIQWLSKKPKTTI